MHVRSITPLVSIIISVYNTEKYLRQCLESVINQTFKDFEVIIINDCSPDNSYKIIEEFRQKDNRIIVINSEKNLGLGFCRNQGLKISKGKYITFIDSDDWVKSNYIEILYNNIKQHGADFVSADYMFYNNVTTKISPNIETITFYKKYNFYNFEITDENIKRKILLNTPSIYIWAKIFNRNFLSSKNIFFKIKFFEDNLFVWETIANAKKFLFINESIYYYRFNRKGSFVYTHKKNFIRYNSALFENLKKSLIYNKIYETYKKEFFSYISIRTLDFMEISSLSYSKLNVIFYRFREKFYTKDYVIFYGNLNLKSKIKLFSFHFCLRHNINYVLFVKIYRFYKLLKSPFIENNPI